MRWNRGATTVWEDWEGTVSHNHYSPSAVCQWLFDTAAGIRVEGENHFVLGAGSRRKPDMGQKLLP